MPEAVIFDYGVGNLLSLKCALERVGLSTEIGVSAQQLKETDAIALPGVGSFSAAVARLEAVKDTLLATVESGTPLIGICLGLQLFFPESEEGPGKGLALFEGKNVRLRAEVKVPHMGWNALKLLKWNALFDGVADESYVYFVHSLYPVPADKEIVASETEYGATFTSAIASKNVFGTQFHPEKSGDIGLKILENFAKIVKR
ncbi:MAG: imidazole glycerol phosphate synthase subunit HisH [Candidatus Bathyarchaeota archaeon]|nr:imidazole glycerol phosphate synthase subunit HisH [Candidatus Bathyarchaeota archaeon]